MPGWIFQANPDTFNVDAYFALQETVTWSIRQERLADQMQVGDRVFFWRASGDTGRPAGIIAAGRLVEPIAERPDDPNSLEFWSDPEEARKTTLRGVVRIEERNRFLPSDVVAEDPLLQTHRIVTFRAATNFLLNDEELHAVEGLWSKASPPKVEAWLLLALGPDERQDAGNRGYEDDVSQVYRYDSFVPNHKRIRPADVAVLRSTELLGLARIVDVSSREGTKELLRCPNCKNTSHKERKQKTPRYRCHECKTEFDDPVLELADATLYEAWFGDTFVGTPGAVPLDVLREACPNHNGDLAMQRIGLDEVLHRISSQFPRAAAFGAARWRLVQSEQRLSRAQEKVTDFEPSSIQTAREKTLRAITTRRGQTQFRRRLLSAYDARCAVTGCDAIAALEAAHIIGYQGPETNHVQNGLLLRADIHTLFDVGLMSVDPEALVVVISPQLRGTQYEEFAGRRLRLPENERARPNRSALESHYAASDAERS